MTALLTQHFILIVAVTGVAAVVALAILVALFQQFKADAIRDGHDDPTKIAVALTLSTVKNVLLLRRAAKGELPPPRARTSAELDMTITPGTLKAGELPAPPARSSAEVKP